VDTMACERWGFRAIADQVMLGCIYRRQHDGAYWALAPRSTVFPDGRRGMVLDLQRSGCLWIAKEDFYVLDEDGSERTVIDLMMEVPMTHHESSPMLFGSLAAWRLQHERAIDRFWSNPWMYLALSES